MNYNWRSPCTLIGGPPTQTWPAASSSSAVVTTTSPSLHLHILHHCTTVPCPLPVPPHPTTQPGTSLSSNTTPPPKEAPPCTLNVPPPSQPTPLPSLHLTLLYWERPMAVKENSNKERWKLTGKNHVWVKWSNFTDI